MALDTKAKEKMNAEYANIGAEKIQELQPKESLQIFVLPNKLSSRIQGIISVLNTVDGKSYLKGQF